MTRISQYDYILGLIPVCLLFIPPLLLNVGAPADASNIFGSTLGALLIGYAMFVKGPTKNSNQLQNQNLSKKKDSLPHIGISDIRE